MSLRGSYNKTFDTHLTKARQKVDLWTFVTTTRISVGLGKPPKI